MNKYDDSQVNKVKIEFFKSTLYSTSNIENTKI